MESLYCIKLLGNKDILEVEHVYANSQAEALEKGEKLLEYLTRKGLWEYRSVEVTKVLPLIDECWNME